MRIESRGRYIESRNSIGFLRAPRAKIRTLDYVLVSSYHKRLRAEASRYGDQIEAYDQVFRETRLIKKFGTLQIRQVRKEAPE